MTSSRDDNRTSPGAGPPRAGPPPIGRPGRSGRRPAPRGRRDGWFIIDALLAMGVIVILSIALATSMRAHAKATDRLAASRESARLAEQTLVALQGGAKPATPPEGVSLEIRPAGGDSSPADAPAGWKWVTVHITRPGGRATSLTGLVPAAAATTATPAAPTTAKGGEQ